MKRFEYLLPNGLEEALSMLEQHPHARPLAGGTDVLIQMKEQRREFGALMSLRNIGELHSYYFENSTLNLGAAVKAGDVARHPEIQAGLSALSDGAGLIGSIQIRNMATVGGNVCNASPAADTPPALLVLDARAVIRSSRGERVVPLADFFAGPGRTIMQPGEILIEIRIPALPVSSGSAYLRHTPRAWLDIAFVGAAAAVTLDASGIITNARIALGAVAPTPIRVVEAEKLLIGNSPDQALFAEAGRIAASEAKPIDDLRASAEYRRHIVSVLTRRTLGQAVEKARAFDGTPA